MRSARFEFVRERVVGSLFKGNRADHVAAALIGWHLLKQTCLAIEDADASRSIQLVPGEGIKVTIQFLDINRHMGSGLRSVDQHGNSLAVCTLDDFPHGIDCAERVRDMGDRHEASLATEQPFEFPENHFPGVIDWNNAQESALLLAKHLPGNDVRMVLQCRNEDFVSRSDAGSAVRLRYEIDSFGRAANKNDFSRTLSVEEALHLDAGLLIAPRGTLAELMDCPVDIGVVRAIEAADCLNDHLGFLAAGCIIE